MNKKSLSGSASWPLRKSPPLFLLVLCQIGKVSQALEADTVCVLLISFIINHCKLLFYLPAENFLVILQLLEILPPIHFAWRLDQGQGSGV